MSIRVGIDNFFANITTPARLINCLLQGKGEGADIEFRRFWINTTEGMLGFGDPAFDKHGLEPVKEDLGQTLAVWGLGDGFYVVWPLLGPSTLRDTAGMVGDWYANPIPYLTSTDVAIAASGLKAVNKGSFHAGEYEVMFADEIEPYIAARQTYLQYRKKLIEE
jgi:phospholipid-binding lipoprotein MlaA